MVILLLIVLPFVEVYFLVRAAYEMGVFNTVLLLFVSGLLGTWCVRAQAQGIVRKFNASLSSGQIPADELIKAVCMFVGGILLIIPGFVTDIFGLLLLLPPTRFLMSQVFKFYFSRLVAQGKARVHVYSSNGFNKSRNYSYSQNIRDVSGETITIESSAQSSELKDLN